MGATERNEDHGQANAKGWYETIAALVAALELDYDRLEELRDERQELSDNVAEASADDRDECAKTIGALQDWDEANGEELKELADAAAADDANYPLKSQDDARERIQEGPLSVQVRSGWHSLGEESEAEEFEVLLSTGGPALRIRGELSQGEPSRAWLEYQDWGTPWMQYFDVEQSTLLSYCQCFFFGE